MIAVHGARIVVTNTALEIHPAPLQAALTGSAEAEIVPLADIPDVDIQPGDGWDGATATIADTVVRFLPGDSEGPEQLRSLIEAAKKGETLDLDAIAGFDFVALDVETANQHWSSICQVGLVEVKNGIITDKKSWLCRPNGDFDEANIACHGITADDVAGEPSISELLPRVFEYIGERTVVAHNAYFDLSALRYAAKEANLEAPGIAFACTLANSRAANLDVGNHRLPTIAKYFGVSLDNHHDALADAVACAGIMVGLARRAKYSGSVMDFVHNSGFTLGSMDAGAITPVLKDFSGAQSSLQKAKKNSAKKAPWQAVATPDTIPDPAVDADPNAPLYGHNVTLTGEFEPFDKGELWDGIAAQGGQVGKNVTKKTTILVTGEWATMTSKEKRARELIEKGQEIEIWPAEKIFSALNLKK